MASLLPQLFLDSGAGLTPSDGALLYFNVVGSGTDKNTYTTAAATAANANPVVADSKGVFPPIYISGSYDWVLQNKNAVQQNAGTVSELVITADLLLSSVKPFPTLAAAVADTGLANGDALNLKERTTGNGGGALWDVVFSSTVTENTYNIVQCTGVGTLSLVLRIDDATLNTAEFGVTDSGSVSANTLAAQAALDLAATNGYSVTDTEGTYNFSTLLIKNGTKCVDFTSGTWTPDGNSSPTATTTQAAVILQGAQTGGTIVTGCKVSMQIDMQNGDRTAILGDGCQECEFTGCDIYGFTNDATYNHRGIRLQEAASGNIVTKNEIVGFNLPTQRGLLIELINTAATNILFGGFFTGTVVRQPGPAVGNIITNNKLTNGSYALNCQGGERNIFSNNICINQNHRGIWMGNGSWYNNILGNQFRNFLSSAVLLGYSCNHNNITDNICINEEGYAISGEAVINVNTGSSYNLIANNHLDAPMNYSVYIATDSSYNLVCSNYSKNAYTAAFAVENDWIETRPTNNFYSRANYEDPTSLAPPNSTSWTYNDLVGTVIQNNVIHSGYTGRAIAAISIAQIQNGLVGATPTELGQVSIKNNEVLTNSAIGYGVYMYEHIAAKLNDIKFNGNVFVKTLLQTTADFAVATPSGISDDFRDHGLVHNEDNGQLDVLINSVPVSFVDLDATPDVSGYSSDKTYFLCANTGATSITDFDAPYERQEILIRLDSNTTIVYNTSLIRTISTANITGSSNTFLRFISIGGIWIET